ncbi:mitochondrial carnitine/acylcarnitine carrier protein-like isoform X1 [Fopius arisanus]|uniref:Mitochondrial carnitine/acylcarnitine carrier protein-like isoform X1 n=2 Tax=Fopius arisanus TaxID=64838 RepID=A0A9R1U9G1_9HYME|nr:PREDICTED: mitochondrial carnitine/acylcarnitine carrier protein-like isoform X1 [Fopius arisanus]
MDLPHDATLMKYLIAGGVGGIATTIFGHPLDTVKTRMQAAPGVYKNTTDAVVKTVRREGAMGLYKGITAPLIGIVPIFALSFFSFGLGKRLLSRPDNAPLTPVDLFLAGMFSGLTTTMFSVPGERIKCLLQMQTRGTKYNGFKDAVVKLYQEGGVRNLYVGTCATLLRDVPSGGVYFGLYELMMRFETENDDHVSLWQPMFAGGVAGIGNWVVAMPADVLKSRLQTSTMWRYPKGMRSVFPEILRVEGIGVLYNGLIPVIIRAFPANAVCFLGIEFAIHILDNYFPWV